MKKLRKKFLAGIALGGMVNFSVMSFNPAIVKAADVIIGDNENSSEYSADDWTNNAGSIVVYGGGGETSTNPVSNKAVRINGGSFNGIFGGISSLGNVSKNTVYFNGGNVSGGIVGGFTFYYDGLTAGDVFGNNVYMNGGTVGWLTGGEVGYASSVTDFSNLTGGNVYNNTVYMNDGTVTGGIIGGSALTGNALNNTVNINGGTVSGSIIGGEVKNPTSDSQASGNTINISGSPNLSGATLYGGLLSSSGYSDGNTLNIYTTGLSVNGIQTDSFDNFNFYVQNFSSCRKFFPLR